MQGVEAGRGVLAYLSSRKNTRVVGDGIAEVYY